MEQSELMFQEVMGITLLDFYMISRYIKELTSQLIGIYTIKQTVRVVIMIIIIHVRIQLMLCSNGMTEDIVMPICGRYIIIIGTTRFECVITHALLTTQTWVA